MKTCIRCHIEKDESEYGTVTSKYKDTVYKFLKGKCNRCLADLQKIRYDKVKDDLEFKKKNIERAKSYATKNYEQVSERRKTAEYLKKHNEWEKKRYHKYKDFINERSRIKRKTPEYKIYVKEYRERKKEIIFEQEKITKKRYSEKNKKSVSDEYCINKLMQQKKIGRDLITKDMIDVKRIQILTKRLRNTIVKTKRKI